MPKTLPQPTRHSKSPKETNMAENGVTHVSNGTDEQLSMKNTKKENVPKSHQLPQWILVWFLVTAVVCTWDASFIMCRPYSLPGGSLAWIWYFYKYYVTVDQRYYDIKDAYVFAQSLLNYAEVVMNIAAIVMHYRQSRHTVPTAFMVSVMTMWKTVLYFLMFTDFCTGSEYRQGNTVVEEIFLMVLPNIIWIFLPTAVMVYLWDRILPVGEPLSQSSTGNGYVTMQGLFGKMGNQIQSSKREVLRGPGSGLVQAGSEAREHLAKSSRLSMTSCVRRKAVPGERTDRE